MFDEPIPHPRELIISELEKCKARFFADGRTIQQIPTGKSGLAPKPVLLNTHQKHQQIKRAEFAPALRKLVTAGGTLKDAVKALKLKESRVRMIAAENGIVLSIDSH